MIKKGKKDDGVEVFGVVEVMGETELDHLHGLLQELQDRGIRSIGDLENQIARLQK